MYCSPGTLRVSNTIGTERQLGDKALGDIALWKFERLMDSLVRAWSLQMRSGSKIPDRTWTPKSVFCKEG